MFGFATTRIHPLTEQVIDAIVEDAGGKRAHPDHDRRTARGADYVLGKAVIELKIMNEEPLTKAERQVKVAALFTALDPESPVHVLDRNLLDEAGCRAYDRALEGPIKGAIKSAKGQLVQSRKEYPEATRSILLLVNNGNTTLDHDEIVAMVSRRVRNDTDDIDGIVVAGAYLHSDGFDTFALWPIDYVPIHLDCDFPEFKALQTAFCGYTERAMTASLLEGPSDALSKGPVLDASFDLNGKTFVKPAPPLGSKSNFYTRGRPRFNSTGIDKSPPVGIIFPELDHAQWIKFHDFLSWTPEFGDSYRDWLDERERAFTQGSPLQPLVPVAVTFDDWRTAIEALGGDCSFESVFSFATSVFQERMTEILVRAKDISDAKILPRRFVLTLTRLIGQDEANDVSKILLVEQQPDGPPLARPLVYNARIFHLYARSLGAAYAVKHGVEALYWQKDLTYAWV
jgi:hypothetical protein